MRQNKHCVLLLLFCFSSVALKMNQPLLETKVYHNSHDFKTIIDEIYIQGIRHIGLIKEIDLFCNILLSLSVANYKRLTNQSLKYIRHLKC